MTPLRAPQTGQGKPPGGPVEVTEGALAPEVGASHMAGVEAPCRPLPAAAMTSQRRFGVSGDEAQGGLQTKPPHVRPF